MVEVWVLREDPSDDTVRRWRQYFCESFEEALEIARKNQDAMKIEIRPE